MKKKSGQFFLSLLGFLFAFTVFADGSKQPRFSVTYNPLQTAGFLAGSALVSALERKVLFLPLHFDAYLDMKDWLSLSLGLVYRYKDLKSPNKPLYSSGEVSYDRVGTNHHELFLTAGPRFTPFKTGLKGFYLSIRAGIGTAISPVYFNISSVLQPETGYTFMFGNPGFTLTLGAGVMLHMPVYQNLPLLNPKMCTSTAIISSTRNENVETCFRASQTIDRVTPIANLGLGFNW